MFERLESRAAVAGEARVADRIAALAAELRELLPRDISVDASEDGVRLTGPRLGEQFVLDSSLRWTIAGLLK